MIDAGAEVDLGGTIDKSSGEERFKGARLLGLVLINLSTTTEP